MNKWRPLKEGLHGAFVIVVFYVSLLIVTMSYIPTVCPEAAISSTISYIYYSRA